MGSKVSKLESPTQWGVSILCGVFSTEQLSAPPPAFNDDSGSHDKAYGAYHCAYVHNLSESSQ